VPRLADTGLFVASESTSYRMRREERQLAPRGDAQAPVRRAVPAHFSTEPEQLWSWHITYLRSRVRDIFWYVYLIMEILSSRMMGWAMKPTQRDAHAATLFTTVCREHAVTAPSLVLRSYNGGPMKGDTTLANHKGLGVLTSFSRPRISDGNPYSEALFRTLKYYSALTTQPFATFAAARA
jgi:putative transposase